MYNKSIEEVIDDRVKHNGRLRTMVLLHENMRAGLGVAVLLGLVAKRKSSTKEL